MPPPNNYCFKTPSFNLLFKKSSLVYKAIDNVHYFMSLEHLQKLYYIISTNGHQQFYPLYATPPLEYGLAL